MSEASSSTFLLMIFSHYCPQLAGFLGGVALPVPRMTLVTSLPFRMVTTTCKVFRIPALGYTIPQLHLVTWSLSITWNDMVMYAPWLHLTRIQPPQYILLGVKVWAWLQDTKSSSVNVHNPIVTLRYMVPNDSMETHDYKMLHNYVVQGYTLYGYVLLRVKFQAFNFFMFHTFAIQG